MRHRAARCPLLHPARACALALLLALSTFQGNLFAQHHDVDAVIDEALTRRDNGDLVGAAAQLRRALAASPSPRTEALLAITEQGIGWWVAAEAHMRHALAAADHPWIRQNRPRLEAAFNVIADHVGALQLHGGPAGARVRVDGVAVATLPTAEPLRIQVGTVVVEVTAEGHRPWRQTVFISARTTVSATLRLTAIDLADAGGTAEVSRGRLPRTLGIASFGLAAAGLVMGVYAHYRRERALAGYDAAACAQPSADAVTVANCLSAAQGARAFEPWMITGYAVAGVFALTGLVLYLTLPSSTSPSRAEWTCGSGAVSWSLACAWRF